MKAITLWPEWAAAIAWGDKRVENRPWTPKSVAGGWLAIHAGASIGGRPSQRGTGAWAAADRALSAWGHRLAIDSEDRTVLADVRDPEDPVALGPVVTSAVVAVARVGRPRRPMSGGRWEVGPWVWPLDQVIMLRDPIPAKGRQGLWEWCDWSNLPCPRCGVPVRWSQRDGIGRAHCQDGTRTSRRWPDLRPEPCDWGGGRIVHARGQIWPTGDGWGDPDAWDQLEARPA